MNDKVTKAQDVVYNFSHNTAGTNPILNVMQLQSGIYLNELMAKHEYYHNSFDWFNITKEDFNKMKSYIEENNWKIFSHTGCSKEFVVVDDKENIIKINYSEDRKKYFVMSYALYMKSNSMECDLVKWVNEHKHVPDAVCKINAFIFDEKEGLTSSLHEQNFNSEILVEAYPYIPDPKQFFDKYYNESKASVIIFIGIPGTGKTTLIRNLIAGYNSTNNDSAGVFYTASSNALSCDKLFQQFAQSKSRTMILEDVDLHLTSRSEGNTFMYKLLSASDGVIKNDIEDKKIIISTNLDNVGEIDEALIRKGRCYSVVTFRALDYNESVKLLTKLNRDHSWLDENRTYTLAELFNPDDNRLAG